MKKMKLIVALTLPCALVLLGACTSYRSGTATGSAPKAKAAVATLAPTQGSKVSGSVTFTQSGGGVKVVAHFEGLTPGRHGFHIHEVGDCSAPDASSAKGHFNPGGVKHGAPEAAEHHAGDFGNIEASPSGIAHAEFTSRSITLGEGANSVVSRAVIVHEKADDMTTQPTGNAGGRLACGVVQLK